MKHDELIHSVHYQEVDPGRRWIKDLDVAIDSNGPLDAGHTLTPNVVRTAGGYRIYYNAIGPERPRPETTGYILSAFSTDAKTWQKEEGVRMDAGGEGTGNCIWGPDVIPLADGSYRMYFEGRIQGSDGPVKSVIGSARSPDGIDWRQEPGIRLEADDTSYGAPRCLYIAPDSGAGDGRYRLYASDFTDHCIVSAVSDDGLLFELEPGVRVAREKVLEGYEVYAPEVLRLGDGSYRMYYAGWVAAPEVPAGSQYHGRVFSAVSADGLQWLKDPDICIDNGGKWDRAKASEPCVIDLPDGRFRMFYEACDYEGRWRIATATSEQP